MSQLHFSPSHARATAPSKLIHSDVWVPNPVVSIDGYRYYVSFVDNYTSFHLAVSIEI